MSKMKFTPAAWLFSLIASTLFTAAQAQKGGPGVGQWKSFIPYGQVNGVVTDGTTFFCSTTAGFFTYNREDGSLTPYSKANGMGDIGMSGIAYDKTTGYAVLAYTNSNVDLFKDNTFYSQPELKITQVGGDKTIYHVAASDGQGYLSTGIGLLVLNLSKNEPKEMIKFSENSTDAAVYASLTDATYLYAATRIGLYRIEKNSPFVLDDDAWTKLDNKEFQVLGQSGNTVYAATADSLFGVAGDGTVSFIEQVRFTDTMASTITSLDPGAGNGLWVSVSQPEKSRGFAVLRNSDGSRADSLATIAPSQVVQLANGDVWFGDESGYSFPDRHGLRKKTAVDRSEPYYPDGPVTSSAFDVSARNGEFWLAHGGKSGIWGVTYNRAMFSHFKEEAWVNYPYVSPNPFVQDFIRILKDWNGDHLYAASFSGGLYEMSPSGVNVYNDGYLEHYPSNPNTYYVTGLALDENGTLWMTNHGSQNHELVAKTRDNKWIYCRSIDGNTGHPAVDVIIDDYGLKWFVALGNGVVVYDDNGTLENTADDRFRLFKAGKGSGNLPDNGTTCIAKDKDGAIWVGTTNGIGIINCGDQVFDASCEGELRIIQNDQFAGYLFEGQAIRALAVDGANRKWVGTSNGLWLLSEDGSTTIYRFTDINSPLPSNAIERINLDPVTGDVYISTDKGLVSFRGTATEGNRENDETLYIYPNPVPSDYNGMVAVRGIAENADVRFTDISGQLVYRTRALGGQAVWNCKDYTGRKVQSGVYLVFTVNKDGTQKASGKFIIHQ